jgi:hypothetical protein
VTDMSLGGASRAGRVAPYQWHEMGRESVVS